MVKTRRQAKESISEAAELNVDDTDNDFQCEDDVLMPINTSGASNTKRRLLLFFMAFCYIVVMMILAKYGETVSKTTTAPVGSGDGGEKESNIPSCMQSSTEKNPLVRAARCFGKRVSRTNQQLGQNLKQALNNAGKRGRMNHDGAKSSSTTSVKVEGIDQVHVLVKPARK